MFTSFVIGVSIFLFWCHILLAGYYFFTLKLLHFTLNLSFSSFLFHFFWPLYFFLFQSFVISRMRYSNRTKHVLCYLNIKKIKPAIWATTNSSYIFSEKKSKLAENSLSTWAYPWVITNILRVISYNTAKFPLFDRMSTKKSFNLFLSHYQTL